MIDLGKQIEIDRPQLLNEVYTAICDAVQARTWEVTDGLLAWGDTIDVTLRNRRTGSVGRLDIDVYHGRPGTWTVK